MGFGAGHIADMINRIKQNKSLSESRRSKKRQNHSSSKTKTRLKFPKASEKRIKRVKKIYGSKNRNYLLFISLFLIVLFISLLIFSIYGLN
jgi:hypothetical protein